jgi:DNA-binding transcriptional LysR family regulator
MVVPGRGTPITRLPAARPHSRGFYAPVTRWSHRRCRTGGFVDDALAAIGKHREVSLMLPHFLVMPFAIAASDLVVTMAERVARIYADVLPVRLFPPPLSLPKFRIASYWHQRDRHDPAIAWFRMKMKSRRFELAKAARSTLHP